MPPTIQSDAGGPPRSDENGPLITGKPLRHHNKPKFNFDDIHGGRRFHPSSHSPIPRAQAGITAEDANSPLSTLVLDW